MKVNENNGKSDEDNDKAGEKKEFGNQVGELTCVFKLAISLVFWTDGPASPNFHELKRYFSDAVAACEVSSD